jgi:hypothetical protein
MAGLQVTAEWQVVQIKVLKSWKGDKKVGERVLARTILGACGLEVRARAVADLCLRGRADLLVGLLWYETSRSALARDSHYRACKTWRTRAEAPFGVPEPVLVE